MKFRKMPVVIEAFKWTADHAQGEDPVWIIKAITGGRITFENLQTPSVAMLILTPEGIMRADRGDWIIQGIKGEIYPCKPDIFEATYEKVAD